MCNNSKPIRRNQFQIQRRTYSTRVYLINSCIFLQNGTIKFWRIALAFVMRHTANRCISKVDMLPFDNTKNRSACHCIIIFCNAIIPINWRLTVRAINQLLQLIVRERIGARLFIKAALFSRVIRVCLFVELEAVEDGIHINFYSVAIIIPLVLYLFRFEYISCCAANFSSQFIINVITISERERERGVTHELFARINQLKLIVTCIIY